MADSNIEVVIVGAGPVGLAAACMLQHFGIKFIILDKKPTPTSTSNALLINMRVLQLLEPLGLTKKLIQSGTKLNGMSFYASKRKLLQVDVPENMPYKFLLTLPQTKTESVLRTYLNENMINVQQNWEFISYQSVQDRLNVLVKTPEGEKTINSKWLLGCDGVHSLVRKQCGIHYEGKEIKSHFVMIDANIEAEHYNNKYIAACFQPDLTFAIFPYQANGLSRLLAEVSRSKEFDKIDYPSLEDMQKISNNCLPFKCKITNMTWSSKFWVQEHLADRYNTEQVFLVGDAAHCHSPAGGLGMNTGIQDAINLCWKIYYCSHNKATVKLLDTYNMERRPVGQTVIKMSSSNLRMVTIRNQILYHFRNFILKFIFKINKLNHKFMKAIHQLNLKYSDSLITQKSGLKHLYSGMAMPDFSLQHETKNFSFYTDMDPKYFYILCFTMYEDVQKLHNQYKWPIVCLNGSNIIITEQKRTWPKQGVVIIRPDGYIALTTTSIHSVKEYFQKLFVEIEMST